jgi:ABC-type multidrug transport system ATPase subunit
MEEADVLSDRIVIMAKGVVHCNGSPMFLKRHFGEHNFARRFLAYLHVFIIAQAPATPLQ